MPEHSEWLTAIANRLRREASALKKPKGTAAARAEAQPAAPPPPPVARPYEKPRRFPRWIVAIPGHLYGKTGASKGLISEVSEAGLKMATGLACRIGDEVVVAWRLDHEGEPFEVTGVVRYCTSDGIGIEFLDISPVDRIRIHQYCDKFHRPMRMSRAVGAG